MDFSFKNLPQNLFSTVEDTDLKPIILWVPPLKQHSITEKIDWLSGMQISNVQFAKKKKWPEELKKIVQEFELPLDETPPFENSKTLIFSLPNGFKASIGIVVTNSDWSDRSDVYEKYMKACENFKASFSIQSLDPWPSAELSGVEWIKI